MEKEKTLNEVIEEMGIVDEGDIVSDDDLEVIING